MRTLLSTTTASVIREVIREFENRKKINTVGTAPLRPQKLKAALYNVQYCILCIRSVPIQYISYWYLPNQRAEESRIFGNFSNWVFCTQTHSPCPCPYCSGMCEFLRVLLAAVDEMTNNSLHNGDSLYFLNVVCTHLDPALLLTICFYATTTSDFILKIALIIHQQYQK
jgi:hypothetical protein